MEENPEEWRGETHFVAKQLSTAGGPDMVEQLLGELSRVLIHSAAVVMQTPLLARHLLLT